MKPVSPFDPEKDSDILRKAMKGIGTDERAIIDVLCRRSNAQRQEIRKLYKTMFGRDLIHDLKSELGGRLESVIIGLMTPKAEYDATHIRKAIEGAGTDEDALIEILCTRTNADIEAIRNAYKLLYHRDVEKDLVSDTSGDFRKLMVALSAGGRMENQPVNLEKARADATAMYQAGKARWGTDESVFNRILCSQSFPQLRAVFDEYQKVSGSSVEQSIDGELSGNLRLGMHAIIAVVRNKASYFATRLHQSMKGAGTDDRSLVRIMVTRCEVDMVQIKQEFQKLYGKTLESFIQEDTSGDYRNVLSALVRG